MTNGLDQKSLTGARTKRHGQVQIRVTGRVVSVNTSFTCMPMICGLRADRWRVKVWCL